MKRKKHALIAAGLAAPEADVESSARWQGGSLVARIAALDVGDTAAKAKRLDDDLTVGEIRENMARMREELRNSVTKAVGRAREQAGGEYRVEVFDTHSLERSWFLLALITRVK